MMGFNTSQRWGFALLFGLIALAGAEALFWQGDIALQQLGAAFEGPSLAEPFGRDHFGRSNFARLASALRTSLLMAICSVALSSVLGVALGMAAGWKRGAVDRTLSFVVNVLLALPGLILVLLFGALIPGSFAMLYLAISLVLWVDYFRLIRARTISLIRSPEVEASRLYGFGVWYIFKRHLWPNFRKDVYTLSCFGAGNAVLALASIGFVYVGLKPPHAELGLMMVELFPYYSDAPWVLLQPLCAVICLVLSFHMIAGTVDE